MNCVLQIYKVLGGHTVPGKTNLNAINVRIRRT
jgi:hypothetical protein